MKSDLEYTTRRPNGDDDIEYNCQSICLENKIVKLFNVTAGEIV